MKTITVEEIIDAIEANGYKKIKYSFIDTQKQDGDYKVIGACAIGQAALNLGVNPLSLSNFLGTIKIRSVYEDVATLITHKNDFTGKSLRTIAKEIRALKEYPTFSKRETDFMIDYLYRDYANRSKVKEEINENSHN